MCVAELADLYTGVCGQGSDVYVGLGRGWSGYRLFIRDLVVDALKGGRRGRGAAKLTAQRLRVRRVGLAGGGLLRGLRLASSAHSGQALQAADWLLRHQTGDGAWTVPVPRQLTPRLSLAAHWSSAMAQGQAMSLLTRAYRATGDGRYLRAARRAAGPFSRLSADRGVRTVFQVSRSARGRDVGTAVYHMSEYAFNQGARAGATRSYTFCPEPEPEPL